MQVFVGVGEKTAVRSSGRGFPAALARGPFSILTPCSGNGTFLTCCEAWWEGSTELPAAPWRPALQVVSMEKASLARAATLLFLPSPCSMKGHKPVFPSLVGRNCFKMIPTAEFLL